MPRSANFRQLRKRRLLLLVLVLSVAGGLIWFMDVPTRLVCRQIRQLLAAGEVQQALKLSEQLASRKPDCAQCQFLLAKSARRAGEFLKAEEALVKARDGNWNPSQILYEKILASAQSGQVRVVERELRQIFQGDLQPHETAEVYEALALGNLAAFDAPEFFRCIDFWLEWDPAAVKPRQMKAEFYLRLGDHQGAMEQFKEIVNDHPEFLPGRKGLADSLLALNLPAQAEKELRICYANQATAQHAVSLAKCLVRIDRSDEAKALLETHKDTEDRVTRAEILEELGRWFLDRQQVDQGIEYLQESVRIAPESSSGWHALSIAYSMKGQPQKASEAMKLSEESQLRTQRFFAVATELSNNPQSISLRLEAADIMFTQGLDLHAVAWLKTILQIDPQNPEANQRLAEYYLKSGNKELAQKHQQMINSQPVKTE